jgi:hypothetical protein
MKKINFIILVALIAAPFFFSSCKKKTEDPGSVTPTCTAPIPTISAGGPTTFCSGSSVLLTANSTVAGTYQWFNGGVAIGGETNSTYTATAAGTYTVVVTSTCASSSAPTTVNVPAALIAQENIVTTGGTYPGTQKKVYKYNANKKLVKIEYTYSPNTLYSSYDTITYNGSNEIVTVKSYNVGNGTAFTTKTYTYTSGRITKVNEVGTNGNGAFNSDRNFTYTSGVLSAQTVVYNSGSASGGGPENISSIVFTAGNPTSADLGLSFGGAATITYETTAPNPYYGLNNDDDIILMFPKNNATSAYSNAAPGSPFFTTSYTYSNGRVATITDDDGNGGTRVNTITYVCL